MKRFFLAIMAALPLIAFAQSGSSQAIKLVVGYAAGGSVDIVARNYATRLQNLIGQNVIVENRGGASGALAANYVKSAAPDGTTIYFVASPTVSMTPAFTKTSFDPVKDFIAVGSIVKYSNVLLVNANSPFKTINELIDFGKKNPQQISYGSAGPGSSNHLSGALLARHSGTEMIHVPYKGNAPAVNDLMGGQITFVFDANNNAINQIKGGRVRPLAVTSEKRNARLPAVPTLIEAGLKDFRIENWIGLLLPAGASPEAVKRLADANKKIVSDPGFAREIEGAGYEMDDVSSSALAARISADLQFYAKLAGTIKLD